MKTPAMPAKALIALLTVYLIWGTTLGAIRIGVETMPEFVLPCLRFSLAGLLLVAFCLLRGERLPGFSELKIHFVVGTLLFVGGNTLVCWAVKHMTTGLGGLLVATTPFWMVWLTSVLPPRERVNPLAMVGISIGFVGMAILLLPQLTHLEDTSWLFWVSVAAMWVNVFSWSLGSIVARKQPVRSSLLMSVGLQNLFAGLLLVLVALATAPGWTPAQSDPSAWLAVGYLVLFGTIAATPCYLYILQTLPVTVSSTFAYVTPVITVLFGWWFLGESVTPTTILGSLVILSGVMVVQWVNAHQVAKAKPLPEPALEGVSAS